MIGATKPIEPMLPRAPLGRRRYDFRCRFGGVGCGLEWSRTSAFHPGAVDCSCGLEVTWWRSRPL